MNEKRGRAPLAEAMKKYAAGGALAFHTPGHKQGLGAHEMLRQLITAEGLREEVALMSELDNLHHPDGCILEAEQLAAKLWGADEAFFMVNGTTSAIHTMLMSALSPGDEVLVPRNAHRSITSGLVLTGARPVYLQPERDDRLGIAMGVTKETVRRAIEAHPSARALVVVYPTYYGVATDLSEIVKIAHLHDMPVLVDEAHGAHLRFSDELPPDAIASGADLVAQSTHKLLGSLTQTSMLFAKKGRIPIGRIRRSASLLTSTSTNYLLLASLDIARLQMEEEGRERVARALSLARNIRQAVNEASGLWAFGPEYMKKPGAAALDEMKVTVQVTDLGFTGAEAEQILRWEYGIQSELADAHNVLFIISMADTEEVAHRLVDALADFAAKHSKKAVPRPIMGAPPEPVLRLTPREAFFAKTEVVDFSDSVGRVSAEEITFYPPGIPVLSPGEEVTPDVLAYVSETATLGLRVTGPEDTGLRRLRVIR